MRKTAVSLSLLVAVCMSLSCTKANGVIVVTIDSQTQLTGIAYFDVAATINNGPTATFRVGQQGAVLSIPPQQTFGVYVPGKYTGTMSLTVTARASDDSSIGVGQGSVALSPAARRDVTIELAGGPGSTDNDLGMGDMGGFIDVGDGGACMPGVTPDGCSDPSTLQHCGANGQFTATNCPLGCATSSPAHCMVMYPTPPVANADLSTQFVMPTTFSGTVTVHTDTGQIETNIRAPNNNTANNEIHAGIAYRKQGNLGIFTFQTLTIADGATVHLVGANPVAFVSQGDMKILGVVDAQGPCGGVAVAGGFLGGSPNNPGQGPGGGAAGVSGNGGAGAGHGDVGGNAGSGTNIAMGGAAYDLPTLISLEGGSGGGGGAGSNAGNGGSGGGAIQLVSGGTITIGGGTAKGGVNAGGCGASQSFFGQGGGGGGSGGAILIEAINIALASNGVLAANGGSGSGDGLNGVNGQFSAMAATPGGSPGFGGAGTVTAGMAGGAGSPNPGGGGAVGFVRLNSQTASAVIDAAAIISPSLTAMTGKNTKVATQGVVDIH